LAAVVVAEMPVARRRSDRQKNVLARVLYAGMSVQVPEKRVAVEMEEASLSWPLGVGCEGLRETLNTPPTFPRGLKPLFFLTS
jgi:hypothetical protein